MVKKILAVAAVLLIATAGAAHAQTYPPGGNTVTADDTTVAPGGAITLTAQTFEAGSTVTFTLFSAPVVLGTATANSSGVATLTATIPAGTTSGNHTIEATGTGANGQPLTVTLSITVGSGSGIPVTGSSNTTPMTQIAIAAIVGGGMLLLLGNKRRNARSNASETAGV